MFSLHTVWLVQSQRSTNPPLPASNSESVTWHPAETEPTPLWPHVIVCPDHENWKHPWCTSRIIRPPWMWHGLRNIWQQSVPPPPSLCRLHLLLIKHMETLHTNTHFGEALIKKLMRVSDDDVKGSKCLKDNFVLSALSVLSTDYKLGIVWIYRPGYQQPNIIMGFTCLKLLNILCLLCFPHTSRSYPSVSE